MTNCENCHHAKEDHLTDGRCEVIRATAPLRTCSCAYYVEPHNCEYLPVEGKRHHFRCSCGARIIGNKHMTAFKKVYAS